MHWCLILLLWWRNGNDQTRQSIGFVYWRSSDVVSSKWLAYFCDVFHFEEAIRHLFELLSNVSVVVLDGDRETAHVTDTPRNYQHANCFDLRRLNRARKFRASFRFFKSTQTTATTAKCWHMAQFCDRMFFVGSCGSLLILHLVFYVIANGFTWLHLVQSNSAIEIGREIPRIRIILRAIT